MRTCVESALDHPFFGPGDADDWAGAFVADGVCELGSGVSGVFNGFHGDLVVVDWCSVYLIVVAIVD